MAPRPLTLGRPRVLEKVEQAQIQRTVKLLGGEYYTSGTRRAKPPKGLVLDTPEKKRKWFSTRQTPGIPDLMVYLPHRADRSRYVLLFIETKAKGGRLSADQVKFRGLALAAGAEHIAGGLDAFIGWCLERGYLNERQVPHYRVPHREPAPVGML